MLHHGVDARLIVKETGRGIAKAPILTDYSTVDTGCLRRRFAKSNTKIPSMMPAMIDSKEKPGIGVNVVWVDAGAVLPVVSVVVVIRLLVVDIRV